MDTVNIGSNVKDNAFKKIKIITSVKFGSRCTSVGKDAFNGCVSLDKINDNNVIKEIYGGAFANTKLSSVTFRKLESINPNGYGAFENCSNLTNINIQSCKSIPNKTFYNCYNLTDINIQSCTRIGMSAFANCKNLNNVKFKDINDDTISIDNDINDNKIYIDESAFYGCTNLSNIDLKTCVAIGNNAFESCTSLEKVNLNNCNERISDEKDKDYSIGKCAFLGCKTLKEITLSYCTHGIGESAFYNCTNLSRVYINTSSVISLKSNVFYCDNDNDNSNTKIIINNIRFYMNPGTKDIFTNEDKYGWIPYKDHMIELPGKNQILYTRTTENNEKINIDSSKYGGVSLHKYDNYTGSIEFNESIDKLDQEIFKNNEVITSVYLPSNCSEVGDNEFEGCTSLDTFTPSPLDVLKTIGNCAFKDCTSLKSFTIPESIESLGEGIFAGCSNIEKFEGKFVKYNNKAIVYNNTLISVAPKDNGESGDRYYKITDIDSSITRLGDYCFSGCEELRRVDIPSNIESIGKFAFYGCEKLLEVHFYCGYQNFLNILTNDPFGIIKGIKSDFKIFVPESVTKSNIKDVFNIGDILNLIDDSKNDVLIAYKDYIYPEPAENDIIYYSDDRISEKDIPIINQKCFKRSINKKTLEYNHFNNKDISKVIIGENIKIIGDNAFKNCINLEYVYLPNTIEKIGNECFYNCVKLKRINIPNKPNGTVTVEIPQTKETKQTEENNENYFVIDVSKFLILTKGSISFGNDIFYGCTNLEKFDSYYKDFVSGDNRCYIDGGKLMFFAPLSESKESEDYIEDYIIESKINTINNYAFKGCTSLGGITLPDELTTIGESAFEGCKNMCIYTNLSNVKEIGNKSFKDCEKFCVKGTDSDSDTTNNIPLKLSKITSIGDRTFENCKELEKVELNENITSIGDYAFYGCNDLTDINIPTNITHIGNSAFRNCTNYTGDVILKNVESVGEYCFGYSGIKKLDISSQNIKKISKYTFSECKGLCDVTLSKSIEFIDMCAFTECNGIKKIYLPLNLSKLGQNSFAISTSSNANKQNIYITSKSTPPKFVFSDGREDVSGKSVYPFGKNGKHVLPNIRIPNTPIGLLNSYKNDNHWKKYIDNMSIYFDDDNMLPSNPDLDIIK